ncbi:MAG: tRNA (adenosine(37)-N6)-threonylcarbamoyltransferase complex dimerization subunit type 1 TsaB [Anaerolineae bacterium]|nr:tRNA (adenosine(37)-N6)-threonylcarbamoyltransferase complex dimerization subunit type 1 TsaB [Anaerolineae bacterium]
MLLALDTATRQSGLALLDNQTLVAELNWTSNDSQTVELLPRLSQILAWHTLTPGDIQAVAVSLGPGSFTGLRVALSIAKGMAVAHEVPLVGVPTLDASALPFVAADKQICALAPAGRGRVYWATYTATPDETHTVAVGFGTWQGWRSEYQLGDVQALAGALHEPTLLAGEIPSALHGPLAAALAGQVALDVPAATTRRAAAIAALGWLRWRAGDLDDPASLAPIYLQEP